MRNIILILCLFLGASLIGQSTPIKHNVYGTQVKEQINSNDSVHDALISAQDSRIAGLTDTITPSNSLGVSEAVGYTSIQTAIDSAVSGDIVVVYPGTYDESVSLKNGVDLIGVGDVLIDYDADDANQTLIASGDTCTIQGIKIQRSDPSNNTEAVISNLSKVKFIHCRIGDYADYMPMSCDSSELIFLDTDIITLATASDSVSFTGNSLISISGGTMIGNFIFHNSSKLKASVVAWYIKNTGSNGDAMIAANDNTDVEVFVQIEALSMDATTLLSLPGAAVKSFVITHDNAVAKVSGNEIQREISCFDNSTLYMSNVTASIGESRIVGNDSATIFINNWRSVFDVDNNNTGLHNIETFNYTGTMTIRNSHIEFTGYSGTYETMGNPIVTNEGTIFRMYSSTVIDHDNDNGGPVGVNYPGTVFLKSEAELHNCTFRQINSDGLDPDKRVVTLNGTANWRVIMDAVHLENNAEDGIGIFLEFYESDKDTLLLNGVTFDILGELVSSATNHTYDDIVNYSRDQFGSTYYSQANANNLIVRDSLVHSTVAHFFAVTETKERLYKTVLSAGIYGDNSGRVYSDDTLQVQFNFLRPLNHVGGKYWTACDGKFFLTHFSAGVETGEVWDFDMAAANDTAYHTVTEKYDFTSAANYTFTAGEVTNYSYIIYITSTADFKGYAYWYDLMNIRSITFTIIDDD